MLAKRLRLISEDGQNERAEKQCVTNIGTTAML